MARVYGFLQPDGSLLMARRQGDAWAVTSQQKSVEGRAQRKRSAEGRAVRS